ncbi:Mor transcription activator family protein [Faecalispora anaeroviscerum]|uniref:Mor transcription activator family protein n=1 Tax=Faecalispora anaeroviscerum TaxID=2991836 RepID=UPI0024BB68EF|nr:Mor transcription activator family protein [Faecalispora anaeroviscerum]
MSFLETVTLDDLSGEQLEIAELIGIENYRNLVRHFGGNQIRILQEDTLVKEKRDNEIRKLYNGRNELELSQKYNLSDRTIRSIVASLKRIDGQIGFF